MANERETWVLGGERIEVSWRPAKPASELGDRYLAPDPGVSVEDGICYERDVAMQLSDGTTIYLDVYRPEQSEPVPALVAWSPYGKREGYSPAGSIMTRILPPGTCSPGTKFEGPDPQYWCRHGYAVVNPDARGSGGSEGDLYFLGTAEGRDCAELIDWAGTRDWCNGKVGMTGNSWLAMSQWFAGAERPEHLACLAPWEGLTDVYRQLACVGGIPEVGFMDYLVNIRLGPGRVEDLLAMMRDYPMMNAYWEDKIPDLSRIEVPVYVTAGWSHFHLLGSIEAFRRIPTPLKWLRVHREFEWIDYYLPECLEDLRRFFDRYLKGIRNGWELTPPVRIDVMDAGEHDHASARPEREFPLARAVLDRLFLDAAGASLVDAPPPEAASVDYDAATGSASFSLHLAEDTEITGYLKLRLWVEALGADDMDLFVAVKKYGADGEERPTLVLGQPHPGAWGLLRVSHREEDPSRTSETEPYLSHRHRLLLVENEVVPVNVGIWPTSRLWRAGEELRVVVSGHYVRDPDWFESFSWDTVNRGTHRIHTGGAYDSHLLVPRVPARPPVVPTRTLPTLRQIRGH